LRKQTATMSLGSKLDQQTMTERILVVEDDRSVQKTLKRLLEAEGFAVEGHPNGRAGLDSFHAEAPSAALLDLHLPELSGKHLCQVMKTAAPSSPTLTASCDLNDKVTLLELGADGSMTKPFSPREIVVRLKVSLRHWHPPAIAVFFDCIVVHFGNRNIDNQIMKLRRKLENDPGCPTHFRTAPRLGYKFSFWSSAGKLPTGPNLQRPWTTAWRAP